MQQIPSLNTISADDVYACLKVLLFGVPVPSALPACAGLQFRLRLLLVFPKSTTPSCIPKGFKRLFEAISSVQN